MKRKNLTGMTQVKNLTDADIEVGRCKFEPKSTLWCVVMWQIHKDRLSELSEQGALRVIYPGEWFDDDE